MTAPSVILIWVEDHLLVATGGGSAEDRLQGLMAQLSASLSQAGVGLVCHLQGAVVRIDEMRRALGWLQAGHAVHGFLERRLKRTGPTWSFSANGGGQGDGLGATAVQVITSAPANRTVKRRR